MKLGVIRESFPGEARVALVPGVIASLAKRGVLVQVEAGAGSEAGYGDDAYAAAGAELVAERAAVVRDADLLAQVRGPGANPRQGDLDLELTHPGQILVGLQDPLGNPERVEAMARRRLTVFGLELLPRISRAQAMDVLSSMANLAGYKAVLLAAAAAPRVFPMMMTAAGTLAPARVLVLGAGVAGLQAIATAKRLGAVVEAYDVRPEVREQVLSVGGKFVDLGLDTTGLADQSGYAKAQSADFSRRQQQALGERVRAADVVITTAQVPGRRAPVLITAAMMQGMKRGAVIVDLAAEQGGNCEKTKPGETRDQDGVSILGPLNLPSTLAFHASQLYAKNIATFVLGLVDAAGAPALDLEDQIIRDTLLTRDGVVVNARVRAALEPAQAKTA
ncbi:MAG: NAD(P) transhydrogenase subunit alpha [Deltaproteobacteria bacterium]|nr:NAD(P) transhydrogenase subunit alpha [Deltaproteobacteria bacterium]